MVSTKEMYDKKLRYVELRKKQQQLKDKEQNKQKNK